MAHDYTLLKRRGAHGIIWYYRLRGQQTAHSTGQHVKADAKDFVGALLGVSPSGRRVTVADYSEPWFKYDTCPWVRRRLAAGYSAGRPWVAALRGHVKNHIVKGLGRYYLDELNPVLVENWLAGIERTTQTRRHVLATLGIMLTEARREGLLSRDPVPDVTRPRIVARGRDILTLPEIRKLFPWRSPDKVLAVWGERRWAVSHYLMLTAGLRVGEVCGLRWPNVRLDARCIVVSEAIKADALPGLPKNGTPRAVALPAQTVTVLEDWRKQSKPSADYVFPGGAPAGHLNPKTLQRVMPAALEAAGIPVKGRYLGAHSLRHTYVTRMRTLLPEAVLQFMTGHSDARMTDHYDGADPATRLASYVKSVKKLPEPF